MRNFGLAKERQEFKRLFCVYTRASRVRPQGVSAPDEAATPGYVKQLKLMNKQFPIFLLLVLLAQTAAVAQSHYTIMVGTFFNAKSQDFTELRSVGLVYAFPMEGNLSQVYVGGYEQKADAERILATVKQRGYAKAYIQERPHSEGQTMSVIQLGMRNVTQPVDWSRFDGIGDLFAIVNGAQARILVGVYKDDATAKAALPAIRQKGFPDAFTRSVNTSTLVKLNEFETGIKRALIPFSLQQPPAQPAPTQPAPAQPAATKQDAPAPVQPAAIVTNPTLTPKSGNQPTPPTVTIPGTPTLSPKTPGQPSDVPKSFEDNTRIVTVPAPVTGTPLPVASSTSKEIARPAISPSVKRRSALDLQTVMKAEKAYTGSLDGFYGPGTATAFDAAWQANRDVQKYELLTRAKREASQKSSNSLQTAINGLTTTPSAAAVLASSSHALGKAYSAYATYLKEGFGTGVNNLMNAAIKTAFADKKTKSPAPAFDHKATYSYTSAEQLVQHLYYLHAATKNEYTLPCWLHERHPRESLQARAAFAGLEGTSPLLTACDNAPNWHEVQVLQTIAADINTENRLDQARLAADAAIRAKLMLEPSILEPEARKSIENWHSSLWIGLNSWANRDPANERAVTALKLAYFQSQVRLEDYFLGLKYTPDQAKGMALAVLETLVGYHLDRFVM